MKIRMLIALIVTFASLALAPTAAADWPESGWTGNTAPFPITDIKGNKYECKFVGKGQYLCTKKKRKMPRWICYKHDDGTFTCIPLPPNLGSGTDLAEALRLADSVDGGLPDDPDEDAAWAVEPYEENQFGLPPHDDDPCLLSGAVWVTKEALPSIIYVTWGDGTASSYNIPAGIGKHYVHLSHSYYLAAYYEVWVAKPHSGHGEGFLFEHPAFDPRSLIPR